MNSVQQIAASKFKKKFNTDIQISSCISKSVQVSQPNQEKNQKQVKQQKLRKPIKKSTLKKMKQISKHVKYLTECENSSDESEISMTNQRHKNAFRKKPTKIHATSIKPQKKLYGQEQSPKRESSLDSRLQKQVMKEGLQQLKLSSKNSENNDLLRQIQQNYNSQQDNFLSSML